MIGDGNAVMAWTAQNEAGFDFATIGANMREQADFDGFLLVKFKPAPPPPDDPLQPPF
jgi:CRISPR-associated protein Cas2